MKKILFILALFILALNGSQIDDKKPPKKDEIWPLAVGNRWIYQNTEYDSIGNIKKITNDTISVISDSYVANEHLYQLIHNNNIKNDFMLLTNRQDGLWCIEPNEDIENLTLLFKYPVQVGDSFYCSIKADTLYVESINEKVKIKSGNNYECIKYSTKTRRVLIGIDVDTKVRYITSVFYFCPNIGLIMELEYESETLELKRIRSSLELTEPPILK
jgi:hypothetical protein